ncbi:hypothetical protein [Flammeovirga sp. SubArs3]|uniref:hypothetical protein n=1 Tax=Flammeovirga sp. SubArs3 TaxID=2995316 RepID=UPI00248B20BF|nr:hypothetical protein [Flammeovirga sp. SubArs3]
MALFKRWSRKGYAIFNSLKREIKICVLNVAMHNNAPALIREVNQYQTSITRKSEDDDFPDIDEILLNLIPQDILSIEVESGSGSVLSKIYNLGHPKRLLSTHLFPSNFSNYFPGFFSTI